MLNSLLDLSLLDLSLEELREETCSVSPVMAPDFKNGRLAVRFTARVLPPFIPVPMDHGLMQHSSSTSVTAGNLYHAKAAALRMNLRKHPAHGSSVREV
jgi:hypothetical protein